jgi:hypothetical protein
MILLNRWAAEIQGSFREIYMNSHFAIAISSHPPAKKLIKGVVKLFRSKKQCKVIQPKRRANARISQHVQWRQETVSEKAI